MAANEWDPLLPERSRQTGRNYTGVLTKSIVYALTLLLFVIAFALTIASIALPSWISYHSTVPPFHYSLGLHRRCSSLTDTCEPFPQYEDCHGEDRYFCSMWRSVGFLMTFAIVLMSMAVVAYMVILSGGKRLRETGWTVLSLIIILSVAVQVASMALVAYLFDNDDRFSVGLEFGDAVASWKLDKSFTFCTVSWCISFFCAVTVVVAARILPSEGGYELIPDMAAASEAQN
ncbi:hypothetical protein BGW36DRAFT_212413 [Talaromyces proteolyticus]|uniref:Uncharacterized protein n=1 Tax=Talaromyces proteolyticus TaxID=1131652 RepID=A0AAD4PYB4_9EURO|nr:uncharacterized protein BGW36DRAFT_212413 [Talaromyces proteolyticus]KAH8693896.1 hypothetical protein BGW36DRAFT_212413 [Talaromyces proteolyticus]